VDVAGSAESAAGDDSATGPTADADAADPFVWGDTRDEADEGGSDDAPGDGPGR
jgi:hypothetical protein